MPEPIDGETKEEFISRCIPIVLEDGTASDNEQAAAVCYGLWENQGKKSAAVKAVGDWELEVLAVPFGGQNGGKDSDGEWFSPATNLYLDKIKSSIVTYYHGHTPEGRPQGDPEIIGETVPGTWQKRDDGWWVRVLLDKANQFAKRVWDSAQSGLARASSGSVAHLVRKIVSGEITHWPLAELALIDAQGKRQPANQFAVALPVMKALYEKSGNLFPILPDETAAEAEQDNRAGDGDKPNTNPMEANKMDEMEIKINAAVEAALKSQREADEKARAAKEAEDKRVADALSAAKAEWEADAAKSTRLPYSEKNVNILKYGDTRPYDNLDAADVATMIGVLQASGKSPSEAAMKALFYKVNEDKTIVGDAARYALKAAGWAGKSDEVQYSTLSSYGDDWVGVAYSNALWESIRVGSWVVSRLSAIEVPQGTESINLPLESGDPTFYKVAENTTYDSTMKYPVPTVTSSQVGTSKKSLTLSKMGARVLWTGELQERSLIPFANQLRMQLNEAGQEQLEGAIIDGDTTTTAATNINDIAATGSQGGTELYLLFDGFRHSPIATTTANSRSGAGGLTAEDYLETVKLMGSAGINALDNSKVTFIVDPLTWYATSALPEVKTRDVHSRATLENGLVTGLWGYEIKASANICRSSASRLSNSSGKVDQDVTTNNLYGSILAVRWDQWKFGFQRRMSMETTRFAASDTTEIVMFATVGLAQRDTEASAITYYVGV